MDFLDKMKDGISKGIDTIGAKGRDLIEDTQAQLQLSGLRERRRKSLEELGALAYALFQKGALADEEAKKVCESVADLDRQIAAKQAELKAERQQGQAAPAAGALVKCDCGAEAASGVRFCSACGKKLG